jgi:hypothetical protein
MLRRLERIEAFLNSVQNGSEAKLSAFSTVNVDSMVPSFPQPATLSAQTPFSFASRTVTPPTAAFSAGERLLPPLLAFSGGQEVANDLDIVPAEEEVIPASTCLVNC